MIFLNFRQYGAKAYVLSFPEEGDARTHGGLISSELSPLERGHENRKRFRKLEYLSSQLHSGASKPFQGLRMVHISILGIHEKGLRDLIFASISRLFQEKPLCHFSLYLSRYEHIQVPTPVTSGSWLFFQEDLRPYFLLYQQKGKSQR